LPNFVWMKYTTSIIPRLRHNNTGNGKYLMQWTYHGNTIDELPEGCEAFVYLITNKSNGMMYVAKTSKI